MNSVYIVQHCYEWCGRDELKVIGVYATKLEADAAVARLRVRPGFRNWPDGFEVNEYHLGTDQWAEGFTTSVNIRIPSTIEDGRYLAAVTEWNPGDVYKICHVDEDLDPSSYAYNVGDYVKCEERTVDGLPEVLVAVKRVNSPS